MKFNNLKNKTDELWEKEYNSITNYSNIYGEKTESFDKFWNNYQICKNHLNFTNKQKEIIDLSKKWGYTLDGNLKKAMPFWVGKNILDIGMGSGPFSTIFLSNGCKHYTGIDPEIDFEGKIKVRDFRVPAYSKLENIDKSKFTEDELMEFEKLNRIDYHKFKFTPSDIMKEFDNVSFIPKILEDCDELLDKKYDFIILNCVTEHLNNNYSIMNFINKILHKDGIVYIYHGNYYWWAGHHDLPKNPSNFDMLTDKQKDNIDWNHLLSCNLNYQRNDLNRIRLYDLKMLFEKYFNIIYWSEDRGDSTIRNRLTKEIREKYSDYTLSELLVDKHFILLKYKQPDSNILIKKENLYHPLSNEELLLKNLIIDNKFKKNYLNLIYKEQYCNINFNDNIIQIKTINPSKDEIKKMQSFGMNFDLYMTIIEKQPKDKKYKISFNAKSNNSLTYGKFLKIYTGKEYKIFDKYLTDKFDYFELVSDFNFLSSSKFRIGINDNIEGLDISFKNICLFYI